MDVQFELKGCRGGRFPIRHPDQSRGMKLPVPRSSLLIVIFAAAVLSASDQVNVTQEHNNPSRDGVYIDALFTRAAAANLTRDLDFDGTISGNESNNVYALNASIATVIWQRTDIGPPVTHGLPCGDISCRPLPTAQGREHILRFITMAIGSQLIGLRQRIRPQSCSLGPKIRAGEAPLGYNHRWYPQSHCLGSRCARRPALARVRRRHRD